MIKRMAVVFGCIFASVAFSGCSGGKTVTQSDELIKQLSRWTDETKGLIDEVDQGVIRATDFRPPEPPPRFDLREIDIAGVSAGAQAKYSANKMREGTDLTEEEAQSIYCYLFGKVLNGELSADPAELGRAVFEYVEGRVIGEIPELKFRADMEKLGGAIEDAQEGGEERMKTALATACSQL